MWWTLLVLALKVIDWLNFFEMIELIRHFIKWSNAPLQVWATFSKLDLSCRRDLHLYGLRCGPPPWVISSFSVTVLQQISLLGQRLGLTSGSPNGKFSGWPSHTKAAARQLAGTVRQRYAPKCNVRPCVNGTYRLLEQLGWPLGNSGRLYLTSTKPRKVGYDCSCTKDLPNIQSRSLGSMSLPRTCLGLHLFLYNLGIQKLGHSKWFFINLSSQFTVLNQCAFSFIVSFNFATLFVEWVIEPISSSRQWQP